MAVVVGGAAVGCGADGVLRKRRRCLKDDKLNTDICILVSFEHVFGDIYTVVEVGVVGIVVVSVRLVPESVVEISVIVVLQK